MKLRHAKSALSLAILAATASSASVAYDGYGYSGQGARSQALQLDYFTHKDIGNIWVNPALAGQYQDSVLVNVNNNNNDGNGSGGVLLGSGNSTFGIYIGRDSVSSFGQSLDLLGLDAELNMAVTGLDPALQDLSPESQVDLFYALDTGDLAFGIRFNYQDNQQNARNDQQNFGAISAYMTTFSSIQHALDYRRANLEAQFANDPDALDPADFVFTGSGEEERANPGYASLSAREFNLSLGFAVNSLGLDGALLLGQASGRHSVQSDYGYRFFSLLNDGDDNQIIRQTYSEQLQVRDTLELDKGTTYGVSLRQRIAENDRASWYLSFAYVNQDYSADYTGYGRYLETEWSDDEDNEQQGTYEERYLSEGRVKNESELIRLMSSYELRPNNRTALTLATGFESYELKQGLSYGLVEDLDTIRADVDGVGGLEAGQWFTNFGLVGPEDNVDVTTKTTRIPLVIALEYGLNDRWTTRASISRDIYRETRWTFVERFFDGVQQADTIDAPDADDENQSTQSGPDRRVETSQVRESDKESWVRQPTTAHFGVGYTREGLTVDAFLGKEFFTRGTDNTLFAAVSVGYKF